MSEKALELIDVGVRCCEAFYSMGTIIDGLHEFVSWGDGGVGDGFVLECNGVTESVTVG